MIEVRTVPTKTANKGLFRELNISTTAGTSLNALIAVLRLLRPVNRTPKPRITSATLTILGFLQNITKTAPTNRKTGAYSDKLKETS